MYISSGPAQLGGREVGWSCSETLPYSKFCHISWEQTMTEHRGLSVHHFHVILTRQSISCIIFTKVKKSILKSNKQSDNFYQKNLGACVIALFRVIFTGHSISKGHQKSILRSKIRFLTNINSKSV